MMQEPRTTKEHIIALYGHIEGVKREVRTIKENHLAHIHEDIDKLGAKVDKLLFWLMSGMLTIIITIVGLVAWIQ
jgi:L-lactate utilization protein LutB